MVASDFAAHPSELELVASFLRPRVAPRDGDDAKPCASFIHEADVYSADPADLTREFAPAVSSGGEEAWYFFSAVRAMKGGRKARTVDSGEGCWHSEAGAKPVVAAGRGRGRLGHRQSFSFVRKDAGGQRVRSGWLMVELGLDDGQDQELVLCKVYFSPRAHGAKKPLALAPAPCGSKRKLAADGTARQRRRLAPASDQEEEKKQNSTSAAAADDDEQPDELPGDDEPLDFFTWWRNKDKFLRRWFGDNYEEVMEGLDKLEPVVAPPTAPLELDLPEILPLCWNGDRFPPCNSTVDEAARVESVLAGELIREMYEKNMTEWMLKIIMADLQQEQPPWPPNFHRSRDDSSAS